MTLQQAALILIEAIDKKRCITQARRDVTDHLMLKETSQIVGCIDLSDLVKTRNKLYRLAASEMKFTVIAMNRDGQEISHIYDQEDAINLLKFYKINRIKARIEIK